MVYIRAKTVKGDKYLYLVKSEWDPERSTSKQKIIKYLGKASIITSSDIPSDYRDDPKIIAFLSKHAGENIKQTENLIEKTKQNLFDSLTSGDLDKTLDVFENYTKVFTLSDFYESILKPTMYHIGDLWESDKLGVAEEHVASNIAKELIGTITQKESKLEKKPKVLICNPTGEEHNIACNMIQSFLQSKGFRVINLSPSAPSDSIVHHINHEEPDVVLISITIEDNIKSGQILAKKIDQDTNVPVLIGGQAISAKDYKFHGTVIQTTSIGKIPQIIKQYAKKK